MAISRSSVGQQIIKPGKKKQVKKKKNANAKPKIKITELLQRHRSGMKIGATNLARLKARGLVARTSGKYKGKKKDLGNRGKS
tara:strand:- start:18722 stop:18970 length:249 start_codon:yes stop_codon:yes gene_type:complete